MNASCNSIARDKNMIPNLLHLYKFKVIVRLMSTVKMSSIFSKMYLYRQANL